jgi:hypothetical protein
MLDLIVVISVAGVAVIICARAVGEHRANPDAVALMMIYCNGFPFKWLVGL